MNEEKTDEEEECDDERLDINATFDGELEDIPF